MPNLFSKLPYQVTGDSYEELKKYDPNSRKKINILGWFAIIPSFLWFISCFLLCYKNTGDGVWNCPAGWNSGSTYDLYF